MENEKIDKVISWIISKPKGIYVLEEVFKNTELPLRTQKIEAFVEIVKEILNRDLLNGLNRDITFSSDYSKISISDSL